MPAMLEAAKLGSRAAKVGFDWPDAQGRADDILALETRIADASWSRAQSRDRDKTYNPATLVELAADAPGFPWSSWLAGARVGDPDDPERRVLDRDRERAAGLDGGAVQVPRP